MSTFQVQVLCPNGRRQNVKLNPNAKLMQVLEDVCQKQKFLPAEDYKLVQGRKTLDLTLSMRYTGLPNNAKLELVKAEKSRVETEVMIALQIETGERLQHAFSPATSIWDILLHWENLPDSLHRGLLTKVDETQNPTIQPVCIYLREEVIGELAMRETSLRTLGLTGDKAALRLLHRAVDDQVLKDIVTKIEREKLRIAKLEQLSAKSGTPQDNTGMLDDRTSDAEMTSSSSDISMGTKYQSEMAKQRTSRVQCTESEMAEQRTSGEQCSESEMAEQRTSGEQCTESEMAEQRTSGEQCTESEKPTQHSRQPNSTEHMEVEPPPGDTHMETEDTPSSEGASSGSQSRPDAVERLRSVPGVQVFTPDDFKDLSPQEQEIAKRLAQSFFNQGIGQPLQEFGAAQKKQKKDREPEAPFANFKFPEETKGQQLYSNELSTVRKQEFQPCERNAKVFNLEENMTQDSAQSSDSSDTLPDDFFEITEGDLRSLLAAQRKKLKELEDQPLMTSIMRQAQMEAAYSRYERVAIRVYFPDKLVLQGLFRPRETVYALKNFVKQHLEDKNLQFYCYTSPPKHVLEDDTQTLIEAHLVPATVVYFGSKVQQDHYLSPEVMTGMCSKLAADLDVAQCLHDSNESADMPTTNTVTKENRPRNVASSSRSSPSSSVPAPISSSSASSSSSATSSGPDKQLPKWFKIGKK